MSHDWGMEAHAAAEQHLDQVLAWQDYYDEGEPDGERPAGEDPSIAPFCGCVTCMIRETLHAAWPVIEEAVRAEDAERSVQAERAFIDHRMEQMSAGRCCHCPDCTALFTGHLDTCTNKPGGPWTSHGHDIPGVTQPGDDSARPARARCGGPGLCAQCALDAGTFHTRQESS